VNVNEFERSKSEEAYRLIRELEESLLESCEYGVSIVEINFILEKLSEIKKSFLNGK
jgi:hypothetical protein